jgi:hypothetical protein
MIIPVQREKEDGHVAGLAAILTNIQIEEEIFYLRFRQYIALH